MVRSGRLATSEQPSSVSLSPVGTGMVHRSSVAVLSSTAANRSFPPTDAERNPKRAAIAWVYGELADEPAAGGEFHQLGGLIGIGVDGVVVGRDQGAVGGQRQPHRPMQVRGAGKDHPPHAVVAG